ncbi:integral peroxisomal membrane peroxin-domain-containing protein [Phascolomyces articulosus]|uniref:Integral peroxisomal membrane peroxin-domain-containing protein n=1 Tax=Phascolomyces articulosus TaxID=60185 RepID=A0AAD5JSB7_9FUNG|nr:integral peroxisomal membrane peroxin-domain-containing protein [Phascolomyces articulosus]
MPSATKFHRFKRKNFQGLVYCDYCEKLLWGLARQGVHCVECEYNCHEECSKMVVQCRPPRRISPDSLSVTDSEAESLSKYTSPRGSLHQDDFMHHHPHHPHHHHHHTNSIHSVTSNNNKKRTPPAIDTDSIGEVLRSPTFSAASMPNNITDHISNNNHSTHNNINTNNNNNNNSTSSPHRPSPTLSSSVKAYRKSLKQHVQNTIVQAVPVSSKIVSNNQNGSSVLNPQTTAKSFARVVARSRALYNITESVYDIYAWKHTFTSISCVLLWIVLCLYPSLLLVVPPALVLGLYIQVGIKPTTTASKALVPRYDESSPEYFANLERTQQSMQFLIRIYDNLAYHLGHIWLTPGSYRLLTAVATITSILFWALGRWIIMMIGLVILTNKTWVGSTAEVCLQFILELMQTAMDVFQKLAFLSFSKNKKRAKGNLVNGTGSFSQTQPIEISLYENQRWWAGSGYTSQLLRSERAGWSNLTGSEPLPSKEEMPPPASYEWGETGWELDITGPWTDEQLGLGKILFTRTRESEMRHLFEY